MSDTTDSLLDSAELENLERLMRQGAAGHWPGSKIDGQVVHVGITGLRLRCTIDHVKAFGELQTAALYFTLAGGAIGEGEVFCSFSGYGPTAARAVVEGTCHFCCCLMSAVLHGLGAGEHAKEEAESFSGHWQGLDLQVHVARLERRFDLGNGLGPDGSGRELLISQLLEAGTLPPLSRRRPTLVSLFISETAGSRVVEVKVNGIDWLPAATPFESRPVDPGKWGNFYRELALLVPKAEEVVFDRRRLGAIAADLLADGDGGPRRVASWRGFRSAGVAFLPALSEEEVTRLEARLPRKKLPADYRRFLLEVAGGGAGPGYGLIAPTRGAIAKIEGRRILLLAHAGCGVLWVLLLEGPRAGSVAIYQPGMDGLKVVAGSFADWYGDFWDGAMRDEDFAQHDPQCCAPVSLLSNFLTHLEEQGKSRDELKLLPDSVRILANGQPFYGDQDLLDPCVTCVRLYARFGLGEEVFRKGLPPRPARGKDADPGFLRRLWGSLKGHRP